MSKRKKKDKGSKRRGSSKISSFGRKLDYIMAEKDINASGLAQRAGVSRGAIYYMKRAERPSPRTVFKLAKALDVPVSEFYDPAIH